MLPSQQNQTSSGCVKLQPQAKLPTAAVMRSLPDDDAALLRRLLSERVEYIPNDLFDRPEVEPVLMRPLSELGKSEYSAPADNDDSGAFGLKEGDATLSKHDRERYLFLRLNFCRRNVLHILRRHKSARLNGDTAANVLRWEHVALETRSELVRENVPLVLAMAKRTRIVGVDLTDLISEGNLALLRSVVKFDCARGYKFSTYACRAILKSFSRVATRSARHRSHIPTEFDPELEKGDYQAQRRVEHEVDCVDELRSIMTDNTAQLSNVEHAVITARFVLDHTGNEPVRKARTLEQVGEMIGVTKERVRQIQNKALGKLKLALEKGILAK